MDDTEFLLNKIKGDLCESVASTHFRLLNYNISKVGIENIAIDYCKLYYGNSDDFNSSIKSYIQNIPDLLVSKSKKNNLLSIFIECKYRAKLDDFIETSKDLFWKYKNLLIKEDMKDKIIKRLVAEEKSKRNGFDNDTSEEFDYLIGLNDIWAEYNNKGFDLYKLEVYEYYINQYFVNTSISKTMAKDVKLPILFYVLSKNISKSAITTYKNYLVELINSMKEPCMSKDYNFKTQEESYTVDEYGNILNELLKLRDCYIGLNDGTLSCPCVFVSFSHFPFWVPANTNILSIFDNLYFKDFENSYKTMEHTIRDILDFRLI